LPSEETRTYLENRNRNNICIIGIESVPAIENLDNILSVDGIDAVFVGPNDLSISLGVPDQYDHPDYEAALREVIRICKAHNVPNLFHHQTVELSTRWLREGVRWVLYSSDSRQMHNGVREDFGRIKAVGAELEGDAAAEIGESDEVI
ncbi:MAG TPA: aldolase/citrate lyase family protein, partial [SAR202 cluster bacterium]|nr:aldolase/citrate lyase family protein [SAR202 cluster bacterium]